MKKLIQKIKQIKSSILVVLVGAGAVLGLLLAFPAADAIHVVSTNEFCVSCHTMQSVKETFAQSPHGGNNSQGFVANCVDCHLPNSNAMHELWVKGTDGSRHVFMEFIMGMEELNYDEVSPKRHEYVYESACLDCHKLVPEGAKNATAESSIRDRVHAMAFANKDKGEAFHCAGCHYDIAHPGLKQVMDEKHFLKLAEELDK